MVNQPILHPTQLYKTMKLSDVLVAALALLSLIPIMVVRFMPLQDYPQWMYQAHVLSNFTTFAKSYFISWVPIPNLGSTLPLLILTPVLGAESSAKILIIINSILFVLGYAFYVKRVDTSQTGLRFLGPLFLYNVFFYLGLYSFIIGLTLLLFSFGYFMGLPSTLTWKNILMLTLISAVTYLCHLFVWAPIIIYLFLLGLVTRQILKIAVSQILPFALFILYFLYRKDLANISIQFYSSIKNKLFSTIEALLPFQRVDPFPSKLPILILNMLVVGILVLLIVLGHKKHPVNKIDLSSYPRPMVMTIFILFIASIISPFKYLAGSSGLDTRFMFFAALLGLPFLTSMLHIDVNRIISISLSILVIIIHSIFFISAGKQLNIVDHAIGLVPTGKSMFFASFRETALHGECDQKIANFGFGAYPLEWFPLYEAMARNYAASIIETAALHVKPGSVLQMQLSEYSNQSDRDSFIEQMKHGNPDWDYVVIFHCPGSLGLDNSTPFWQLYLSGEYFDIFQKIQ